MNELIKNFQPRASLFLSRIFQFGNFIRIIYIVNIFYLLITMFKRILPIAFRNLPQIGKVFTISLAMYALKHGSYFMEPAQCFDHAFKPCNIAGQIVSNVVRIEQNGQFIGYAFCFDKKLLVTTNPEFTENRNGHHSRWEYEFFIGEKKLNTQFKLVGKYENLAFIEAKDDIFSQLPSSIPEMITPVEIIRKTTYLSIKQGYFVANDCGFGIIDGKGEVGSLVINHEGVVGVVTQVGRDADRGFLRMVHWAQLKNLYRRISEKQSLYLGISARALEQRDGISVVRISSNSPLAQKLEMGDIITKVNGYKIHHPEDLTRSIMVSGKSVILEIESPQNEVKMIMAEL